MKIASFIFLFLICTIVYCQEKQMFEKLSFPKTTYEFSKYEFEKTEDIASISNPVSIYLKHKLIIEPIDFQANVNRNFPTEDRDYSYKMSKSNFDTNNNNMPFLGSIMAAIIQNNK